MCSGLGSSTGVLRISEVVDFGGCAEQCLFSTVCIPFMLLLFFHVLLLIAVCSGWSVFWQVLIVYAGEEDVCASSPT